MVLAFSVDYPNKHKSYQKSEVLRRFYTINHSDKVVLFSTFVISQYIDVNFFTSTLKLGCIQLQTKSDEIFNVFPSSPS